MELEIEFERLYGSGTVGRWLFAIKWQGRNWCCTYQPNRLKYHRASVLAPGATREKLGEKFTVGFSDSLKMALKTEIISLTKEHGLYAGLRRSEEKLMKDFGQFAAAVVLQHCRPNEAIIEEVIGKMRPFFEKGLVRQKPSEQHKYFFGDQSLGYFFLEETA